MVKKILNLLKRKKKDEPTPNFLLMNKNTMLKMPVLLADSGINIYIAPTYPDNEIMVGYKRKQIAGTGYIYAPYVPMSSTPLVVDTYFGLDEKKDFELT